MKNLADLLAGLSFETIAAPEGATMEDTEITAIVNDSGAICTGCLFFCIKGMHTDGHIYAGEAIQGGARAILVEDEVPVKAPTDAFILRVNSTRHAMALVSAAWYDHPASKLKTVAITGTKGKTTTTYLVRNMLENAGYRVGLIGTIEVIIGDTRIPAHNTTPESMLLQEYLARMVEEGLDAVVMEASSQAFKMHRTDGIDFDIGMFTNLEPDHIGEGEHEDFEDYLRCKQMLFRQCRTGIINIDDAHAKAIIEGHTCTVETFGLNEDADLYAADISLTRKTGELGIAFTLHDRKKRGTLDGAWLKCPTPGRFSVYNALCAIAVCAHFECDTEQIRDALQKAHVRGRIEMVKTPFPFTVIIDYAHNAMSLESLLLSLKEYRPARLITLFGCGGNRARDRRFEMGEISGRISDLTVITSDNPRDEDPMSIIGDIETGVLKTRGSSVTIPDRREAIRYCLETAEDGDVVVLAGKGHEDYQEIKGKRYPMDERVIVAELADEICNARREKRDVR